MHTPVTRSALEVRLAFGLFVFFVHTPVEDSGKDWTLLIPHSQPIN